MNYPVPAKTPKENAKFLDNVRLNKFISEYQQMINRAMYVHGATEDEFLVRVNGKKYGFKSHPHHPCTIWCQTNRSNFTHAVESLLAFYNEHKARGGKGHNNVVENVARALEFSTKLPEGELTPFANCAANKDLGICYKHIEDVHLAYRKYYEDRWKRDKKPPKWTRG